MASTQSKFNKLSTQLATQKKITSITDDAVAAKSILSAKREINLYNGYIKNMNNAEYELKAVDDSLKGAKVQASRALDVGLMAANGTYSDTELNAFKQEIDGIIQNLTNFANTDYAGTYLFSGAAILTKPYSLEDSPAQTFVDNGDGSYTKSVKDEDGKLTTYKMVNTGTEEAWHKWAIIAVQSIYGFDWQGDNVLLARENLLFSYIDYHKARFGREPDITELRKIAEILSWNIWQMDGLKFVIPESCNDVDDGQLRLFDDEPQKLPCEGCAKNDPLLHTGIYCRIKNWKTNKTVKFVSLLKNGVGR